MRAAYLLSGLALHYERANGDCCIFFFFSSRRRHTRYIGDWSSDVCYSDLESPPDAASEGRRRTRQVRRQHGHDCGRLTVMTVSLTRRDVLRGALGVFDAYLLKQRQVEI